MNIRLEVRKEHLDTSITLDDVIGLGDGDLKVIKSVMAKVLWNEEENEYYEEKEALKIVGAIPVGQLREVARDLVRKIKNAAVPLESGKD